MQCGTCKVNRLGAKLLFMNSSDLPCQAVLVSRSVSEGEISIILVASEEAVSEAEARESEADNYGSWLGPSAQLTVPFIHPDMPEQADPAICVIFELGEAGFVHLARYTEVDEENMCFFTESGGWPSPAHLYHEARQWVHDIRAQDGSYLSDYFTGDEGAAAQALRIVSGGPSIFPPAGVPTAASVSLVARDSRVAPGFTHPADGAASGSPPPPSTASRGRGRGARSSSAAFRDSSPVGPGGLTMENITAAIESAIRPLSTKIAALETSLQDGQPLDSGDISAPAGMSGPQLFGAAPLPGLTPEQQTRLAQLVGNPPPRLGDPGRGTGSRSSSSWAGGRAAVGTAVVRDPTVDASTEGATLMSLMQQQMEMNRVLVERMTDQKPRSLDPLGPLVAGSIDLDDVGSKLLGARGCASRQLVIDQMTANPAGVSASIRANLARCRKVPVSHIEPRDMEVHFKEEVPFGTHTCLTYYGFLLARLWATAETAMAAAPGSEAAQRAWEEVHAKIGLGCVFTEQVALQGGSRFKLGWMLTGEEDPPFGIVRDHRSTPDQATTRMNRLADPRWLTANLAYMEDLAKLEERAEKVEKGKGKGDKSWEDRNKDANNNKKKGGD